MAVEMFLRMDGITGGSRNYHHKGWAEVLSWSWGLEHVNSGAQTGPDNTLRMDELSLTKAIGGVP